MRWLRKPKDTEGAQHGKQRELQGACQRTEYLVFKGLNAGLMVARFASGRSASTLSIFREESSR